MDDMEALAFFIELDLTQRSFQALRNKMKACNSVCIPSYKKLLQAKLTCLPDESLEIDAEKGVISMAMQDVLDWQLLGLSKNEKIVKDVTKYSEDPLVEFTFWSEVGADASTSHNAMQTADARDADQNSLFTSFITPISLQATWQDCSRKPVDIFLNDMANSPYGVIYLRMAHEKEDKRKQKVVFQWSRQGSNVATATFCSNITISIFVSFSLLSFFFLSLTKSTAAGVDKFHM